MNITETLFLNVVSRMENGFGELKAEVKASRDESHQGRKDLHKRIDKMEQKIERLQATSHSSTGSFATLTAIFKILEAIYTNWPRIVWVLTAVAAVWGVKNPEFLKVFTQARP